MMEAPKQVGSWWPDWLNWLGERCGPLVDAPKLKPSSKTYPDLGAAPGTYVHER
jgi:polyhydroxyalkanoate synthase